MKSGGKPDNRNRRRASKWVFLSHAAPNGRVLVWPHSINRQRTPLAPEGIFQRALSRLAGHSSQKRLSTLFLGHEPNS
jgi:hypothetical protein